MLAVKEKGLEFDPGFAPYILAFQGAVEYIYADINKFKNFSQKKLKFMQFHKKMLELFYNNLGFYTGCLMWASYILAQPKQKILSNNCFGTEYVEDDNISDTRFMLNFAELFPKDMKYFLGKDFAFDKNVTNLLKTYEEFLILNKGFTQCEYNTDVILPKTVKSESTDEYKKIIDSALKDGNLAILFDSVEKII